MRKIESSVNNWDGLHRLFSPNLNPEFLLAADDPVKCAVFGCGHSLTLREQLFGDICHRHRKSVYPDNFIGEFEWVNNKSKAPALPGL